MLIVPAVNMIAYFFHQRSRASWRLFRFPDGPLKNVEHTSPKNSSIKSIRWWLLCAICIRGSAFNVSFIRMKDETYNKSIKSVKEPLFCAILFPESVQRLIFCFYHCSPQYSNLFQYIHLSLQESKVERLSKSPLAKCTYIVNTHRIHLFRFAQDCLALCRRWASFFFTALTVARHCFGYYGNWAVGSNTLSRGMSK